MYTINNVKSIDRKLKIKNQVHTVPLQSVETDKQSFFPPKKERKPCHHLLHNPININIIFEDIHYFLQIFMNLGKIISLYLSTAK